MKISNYAMSKVEEMRRNNDAIEDNREEKITLKEFLHEQEEMGVKQNVKICDDCIELFKDDD
jgi:hypothetical protein|tara:strand:+ start:477 stop:662 length:186 start_codon:yes stop_codon:yes gene_type:complete